MREAVRPRRCIGCGHFKNGIELHTRGGICCALAAIALVGYIAQNRRASVVDERKSEIIKNTVNEPIFSNIQGDAQNMCVDQYLQRRRIDPVEAEQEIVEKLEAMQEQEEPLLHASTVDICLEFTMIQTITFEAVDANDFCSLLIKEWPLAPCATPEEEYLGMYYEGDMEEWPMTAPNTKSCSNTNIACVLAGVNQTLNSAERTQSGRLAVTTKAQGKDGVMKPIAPPNSKVSIDAQPYIPPYHINHIEDW